MPYWPALILGLILTAYWGRVLRLVYKIRKSTGRSANYRPREKLGLVLRLIWNPAVVVWVAHPYLTAFQARLPELLRPMARLTHAAVAWPATALAAAALAATWVCWKKMGKSWRMGINPEEKTQLIVSGPYAYVRHPIYALSSILMLTSVAIVPSPLMISAGAIHLLLLQWEARREEKYLMVNHGEPYIEYCRHVGRFVPRSVAAYRPREPVNLTA